MGKKIDLQNKIIQGGQVCKIVRIKLEQISLWFELKYKAAEFKRQS